MKATTIYLSIAVGILVGAALALAGPEPVPVPVVSPTPTPSSPFNEKFDLSVAVGGLWTLSKDNTDRYFGQDHSYSGSAAGKYWFTPNIGAELGFVGNQVSHSSGFIGQALIGVLGRYPIGSFAPYGGILGGGIFNGGNKQLHEPQNVTLGKLALFEKQEHDLKLDWKAIAGVEYRITPMWGVFLEGGFGGPDRPNTKGVSVASGVNLAF